jgi:hypothetical protein
MPDFLRRLQLVGLSIDDVSQAWQQFLEGK